MTVSKMVVVGVFSGEGGGVALAREHCKWRRRAAFGQCNIGLRRVRTFKLVLMCRE
jgi:hypothetical protein